jgi:hypothetical protein
LWLVFRLSVEVSVQKMHIRRLAQEIALLNERRPAERGAGAPQQSVQPLAQAR